jgi:predicted small lipoprotein YifL
MKRRLRPPAALAMVALILAGCGSDPPSETATARSTGTGTGTASSTKTATAQDKAVKFSECIRAHGVPHFPDPNAKGEYVFGIDVSPAVWQKAVNACKALEPPGALSSKRSPKQQSAALRFAGCIRANGVKDFPDPVNGDPLVDTTKIPSSNRPGGMTILNAAMHKCGRVLGLAAGGQG